MACAYSDCERIDAGLGYKLFNLFGTGVGGILGGNLYVVLNAGKTSELAFDHNTVSVSVFNDLLGNCNVVLEGVVRAVDHYGGETAVDARLADFEVCTVVEMKCKIDTGVGDSRLCQSHQVFMLCILAGTCGNLKDNGRLCLCGSLGYSLNDLHVVDVERADGITAGICFFEHFGSGNKSHFAISLYFISVYNIVTSNY